MYYILVANCKWCTLLGIATFPHEPTFRTLANSHYMNYNKKYSHNSVFLSPPILRSQAPCYRRDRPWLQPLSPSYRLHITSKMTSCVTAYLLVYHEQNTRRFTRCATLTQTTCLAQEIAHTIIKRTHQLCNMKHMLINITHYLYTPLHYLYEWSSKNQRQQMKIWCTYSHHSGSQSLNYHKFARSRLSHTK